MISEATFVGCRNLPYSMASRLDEPWNFVGEVNMYGGMHLDVYCKCNEENFILSLSRESSESKPCQPIAIVRLDSFPFITGDMLEVMIYFGVCDKCDSVYWARQGPPFKRVRCLVTV